MTEVPSVGFFDSGQGGLTVWEAVRAAFPGLNTLYLGDNARTPYGNKGAETISQFTREGLEALHRAGARMVVVACGTASSQAVGTLRAHLPFPVVGIVEGLCREARAHTLSWPGTVAVLGTRFTVASSRFERELGHLGVKSVWQKACPLWVPLVEEGAVEGPLAQAAVDIYLNDIPQDTVAVLLACTHFSRLSGAIASALQRHLGRPVVWHGGPYDRAGAYGGPLPAVTLFHSSHSIIQAVGDFLSGLEDKSAFFSGSTQVWCTDAPQEFSRVAQQFCLHPVPLAQACPYF